VHPFSSENYNKASSFGQLVKINYQIKVFSLDVGAIPATIQTASQQVAKHPGQSLPQSAAFKGWIFPKHQRRWTLRMGNRGKPWDNLPKPRTIANQSS
jgi:hypothetical protein